MANESKPGLSWRERQIMDVLYARGQATVGEVLEGMADAPSYSAVRATLRVLEDKRQVAHRQEGPRYVYLPTTPQEKASTAALRHVVRTFFNDSADQAVVALLKLQGASLSDTEIERLAERIREAREEGR